MIRLCRSKRPALTIALICIITPFFWGCASLQSDWETPSVSVSSFKALPTQGVVPQFEIGLHIVNPNRKALELKGVAYTVSIEGHKILTGVSNDLPVIEAYGQGEVRLLASVDLFSSISFFTGLVGKEAQKELSYTLNAKLDVGTLYPMIRVTEEGRFSLGKPQ